MKRFKKVLAPIVICALAICLMFAVGCSGSNSETKQDPKANFTGIWELYSVMDNGTEDTESVDMLKAFGMNVYVILCDDDTVAFDLYGEVVTGTWSVKDDSTITIDLGSDLGTVDATLSGDKLSMEQSGSAMAFKKSGDSSLTLPATAADWVSPMAGLSSGDEEVSTEVEPVVLNQVLVDDEYCSIVALDRGADWANDPGYTIVFTNKTDQALDLWADGSTFAVNGTPHYAYYYETVEAGQTSEAFMYFDEEEVGSPDNLVNVTGKFELDDATGTTITTYDVTIS